MNWLVPLSLRDQVLLSIVHTPRCSAVRLRDVWLCPHWWPHDVADQLSNCPVPWCFLQDKRRYIYMDTCQQKLEQPHHNLLICSPTFEKILLDKSFTPLSPNPSGNKPSSKDPIKTQRFEGLNRDHLFKFLSMWWHLAFCQIAIMSSTCTTNGIAMLAFSINSMRMNIQRDDTRSTLTRRELRTPRRWNLRPDIQYFATLRQPHVHVWHQVGFDELLIMRKWLKIHIQFARHRYQERSTPTTAISHQH